MQRRKDLTYHEYYTPDEVKLLWDSRIVKNGHEFKVIENEKISVVKF
jgi:hypothetical protein